MCHTASKRRQKPKSGAVQPKNHWTHSTGNLTSQGEYHDIKGISYYTTIPTESGTDLFKFDSPSFVLYLPFRHNLIVTPAGKLKIVHIIGKWIENKSCTVQNIVKVLVKRTWVRHVAYLCKGWPQERIRVDTLDVWNNCRHTGQSE